MRSIRLRLFSLLLWGMLWCVFELSGMKGVAMAAEMSSARPQFLDVHGHRGASGLAPENTLAAFRKAMALGVDALEMDLHVTRDGEVVIIHDESLDRTTDGRGSIADLTLEEIKQRDAGVRFAPTFRGERIPTLREIIELVKSSGNTRIRLDLEIKFGKGQEGKPEDFEARVLEILRQTGFVDRVSVISFFHPSLIKMKGLEPKIRTGLLAGGRQPPPDPVALVRRHQADYYSPGFRLVTAETVAAFHQAGIPIVPWTVNEEPEMLRLMRLGIGSFPGDGIVTDFPDRLLNLLKARQ